MLSGAEVAALKLPSRALLAVTMQLPAVVVVSTPVEASTLQMDGVLLAKVTTPRPLPPVAASVPVPPETMLGGLLETISAACVPRLMANDVLTTRSIGLKAALQIGRAHV